MSSSGSSWSSPRPSDHHHRLDNNNDAVEMIDDAMLDRMMCHAEYLASVMQRLAAAAPVPASSSSSSPQQQQQQHQQQQQQRTGSQRDRCRSTSQVSNSTQIVEHPYYHDDDDDAAATAVPNSIDLLSQPEGDSSYYTDCSSVEWRVRPGQTSHYYTTTNWTVGGEPPCERGHHAVRDDTAPPHNRTGEQALPPPPIWEDSGCCCFLPKAVRRQPCDPPVVVARSETQCLATLHAVRQLKMQLDAVLLLDSSSLSEWSSSSSSSTIRNSTNKEKTKAVVNHRDNESLPLDKIAEALLTFHVEQKKQMFRASSGYSENEPVRPVATQLVEHGPTVPVADYTRVTAAPRLLVEVQSSSTYDDDDDEPTTAGSATDDSEYSVQTTTRNYYGVSSPTTSTRGMSLRELTSTKRAVLMRQRNLRRVRRRRRRLRLAVISLLVVAIVVFFLYQYHGEKWTSTPREMQHQGGMNQDMLDPAIVVPQCRAVERKKDDVQPATTHQKIDAFYYFPAPFL